MSRTLEEAVEISRQLFVMVDYGGTRNAVYALNENEAYLKMLNGVYNPNGNGSICGPPCRISDGENPV